MKSSTGNFKKAFTLVELLISITIMSIMAALSISAYPQFSEQLSVTADTYKMLAFFRQTQTYGVSAVTSPGVKFVYAFKIDLSTTTLENVILDTPTDTTNQYYVNTSVVDPVAEKISLSRNVEIIKIEGVKQNATTTLDTAYAFFKRPNPESRLVGKLGTIINPDVTSGSFDRLEVTVRSKKNNGLSKKIVILQTGQMYVSDW